MAFKDTFEKWALLRGMNVDKDSVGYFYPETQGYWEAWKASRGFLMVKLPESGYWMGWGNDELMRADDVREAITDAGMGYMQ
jgi:hypothetical protein